MTWTAYTTGDKLRCPGKRVHRRVTPRGEHRTEAREVPCPHEHGRVGPGTVARVRVKRQGQEPAGGPTVIASCPTCHQPIEFWTAPAEQAKGAA